MPTRFASLETLVTTNCFRATLTGIVLLAFTLTAQAEENWPGWRGPYGNGHAKEAGLPTKWTNDSVTWKAQLK